MNKPKISIIVPVYNSEKYLCGCIESVLSQTYRDFELILVDDGSSDSSGQICDAYANKDVRIHVIHKENGGVSSARNRGIKEALGEYIMFIDSDDNIVEHCFSFLFEERTSMPDLTIFSFTYVSPSKKRVVKNLMSDIAKNHQEALSKGLALKENDYTSEVFCFPWNKVYKKSILRSSNIEFPLDISLREDEIFNYRYLNLCHSLEVISTPLYNYNVETTGLTYRKRMPIEDLALADHIISASRQLNCDGRFLQIQYRRSFLYMFSAFANSRDKHFKENVFKKIKVLHTILEDIEAKERKLLKVVKTIVSLGTPLSYYLLLMFGKYWSSRQKNSMNL